MAVRAVRRHHDEPLAALREPIAPQRNESAVNRRPQLLVDVHRVVAFAMEDANGDFVRSICRWRVRQANLVYAALGEIGLEGERLLALHGAVVIEIAFADVLAAVDGVLPGADLARL